MILKFPNFRRGRSDILFRILLVPSFKKEAEVASFIHHVPVNPLFRLLSVLHVYKQFWNVI